MVGNRNDRYGCGHLSDAEVALVALAKLAGLRQHSRIPS